MTGMAHGCLRLERYWTHDSPLIRLLKTLCVRLVASFTTMLSETAARMMIEGPIRLKTFSISFFPFNCAAARGKLKYSLLRESSRFEHKMNPFMNWEGANTMEKINLQSDKTMIIPINFLAAQQQRKSSVSNHFYDIFSLLRSEASFLNISTILHGYLSLRSIGYFRFQYSIECRDKDDIRRRSSRHSMLRRENHLRKDDDAPDDIDERAPNKLISY